MLMLDTLPEGLERLSSPSLMMRMISHPKGNVSLNLTCCGALPLAHPHHVIATPVAKKPVGFCESSTMTFPRPNFMSKLPQTLHLAPPLHSGSESSRGMPSASIKSLCHSTMLSLMKREQVAWEKCKSLLASLRPKSVLPLLPSGPLLGRGLQR